MEKSEKLTKVISIIFFYILLFIPSTDSAKDFKGAELRTIDTFLYGRIEARYKATNKEGTLASFFTYFDGTPSDPWASSKWNEIDLEILGRYNNSVQFNAITPGQTNHVRANFVNFDPSQDYHIYAFEWTPDYVAWFIDNVEVYRQTGDHILTLSHEQKIMMNIWNPTAESWAGTWNPKILPAFAFYDWVSYYSYTPGSGSYGSSNNFSFQWKDDFDSFDASRWQKATHTFGGNNCDFIPDNCVFSDGKMILCLTDATNIGLVDKQPPVILWARADEKNIVVRFSEAIDKTVAETKTNFIVQNVTINRSTLLIDNETVVLSVSGIDLLQDYNLIVRNIKDTASTPNKIPTSSVSIINSKQLSFPVKINVGGKSARGFLADQPWNESTEYGYMDATASEYPSTLQINGTDLDSIYRSNRYGLVSYRVRLPIGKYNVKLMFAEEYFSSSDQRVFDIYVEGKLIENNFDIYARANQNTAYDIDVNNVEVNDEIMEINLCAEKNNPQLNGLVIEDISTGLNDKIENAPGKFYLEQNYPNPFNGLTKINYYNNKSQELIFFVYDILGRQVFQKNLGVKEKGYNEITWNSANSNNQSFSSGVYFYSIVGDESHSMKKLILLK